MHHNALLRNEKKIKNFLGIGHREFVGSGQYFACHRLVWFRREPSLFAPWSGSSNMTLANSLPGTFAACKCKMRKCENALSELTLQLNPDSNPSIKPNLILSLT